MSLNTIYIKITQWKGLPTNRQDWVQLYKVRCLFNLYISLPIDSIFLYFYKPMCIDIYFSISSYLCSYKCAYSYIVCNKQKNKHIAEQIDLFYNVNLKMPFCESDLYKFITKIQKKRF